MILPTDEWANPPRGGDGFLAVGGVSLALIVGTSGIADAAKAKRKDGDEDD